MVHFLQSHDMSLYLFYVSYYCCPCGFIAMAAWSFCRRTLEKVKIIIYYCVTLNMLTKVFQRKHWKVFYQPHEFCLNHWFLLIAIVTEMLNFLKKVFKMRTLRPWITHLSKQAKGQTLHLNKLNSLKLSKYEGHWLKAKRWSWPLKQKKTRQSLKVMNDPAICNCDLDLGPTTLKCNLSHLCEIISNEFI